MVINLGNLWEAKAILSRALSGVDIRTGKMVPMNLVLPASMMRHLRRLSEAIDNEIKIAEPDRQAFIDKWYVFGESKKEPPKQEDENFAEFQKEYGELFYADDFVIPFSPFKLELLDKVDEVIPADLDMLMVQMNKQFDIQQKEMEPPRQGEPIDAAIKPLADA